MKNKVKIYKPRLVCNKGDTILCSRRAPANKRKLYLTSKNVRTPKAFASQLFSLERILYETWNWLLTFLTTFLASNAGTDTPGSNKGHCDIFDIIERNLFIYLHFVFVQLLFFSNSIVLALSCKTYQTIPGTWWKVE